MAEERVIIEMDYLGNITLETKGVKGDKCLDFSKQLEEALGGVEGEITFTNEYYGKDKEQAVLIRGM